jgi:hypothetical protein
MAYRRGLSGVRRRGLSGSSLFGTLFATSINPYTGDILNSDNSIAGNCSNALDWLMYTGCWANSATQWAQMAQLPQLKSNYVPPPAPTTAQVNAALTCPDPTLSTEDCSSLIAQQANALVASLSAQSVADTQAGNLNFVQTNVPDNPIGSGGSPFTWGCDATSDLLGCLGGLPWYVWAGGGLGVLMLVVVLKK